MISTVKLHSRHFSSSDPDTRVITHDSEWISNGYWMILRANVENQFAITPDMYEDNFKRPQVPIAPVDSPVPDFWSFIAFDPTHVFKVTAWTIQSDNSQLRLLFCVDSLDFCLIDNKHAGALGFETGDLLEATEKRDRQGKVFYVLRDEGLTRSIASVPADVESGTTGVSLPELRQIDESLTIETTRRVRGPKRYRINPDRLIAMFKGEIG